MRSAKQKLAKFIAHSFSSVLDVDPEQIEAGLLKSGKLSLNNVGLKPQKNAEGAQLEGEIDEIRFGWSWGKNIVENALVSVSGANLQICMSEGSEGMDKGGGGTCDTTSSWSDTKPQPQQEAAPPDAEVGSTVAQILNDLSVSITDVKLTIETKVSIHADEAPSMQ